MIGRLREVKVTLYQEAQVPESLPPSWQNVRVAGNVLRFAETQFAEESLNARIAAAIPAVRSVEVKPMDLRSIFTVLARAAQSRVN